MKKTVCSWSVSGFLFTAALVALLLPTVAVSEEIAVNGEADGAEAKVADAEESANDDASAPIGLMEAMRMMEAEEKAFEAAIRKDPAWQPSHKEAAVIKADGVYSFCLDHSGNLLVCCGGPREIHVFSPDGKLVKKIPMEFVPQAICVHPDRTVFVAGYGQLARIDAAGHVMTTAAFPALPKEEPVNKEAGEEAGDAPKGDADENKKSTGKKGKQSNAKADSKEEKAEGGLFLSLANILGLTGGGRRRYVSGLAVTEKDLFVACKAQNGHGYVVLRMTHDFKEPKQIVRGLRSCCGQMDIQARGDELWVAENARHRVIRYSRDGEKLHSFGKRDRKSPGGFGGCCEPKNLRFGPDGCVYAAESGPPVVIKKFSPEGEFLGIAGLPKFEENGCVRVTVEVSKDADTLYILDINGSSIYVLKDQRKEAPERTSGTHRQDDGTR